MRAKIVKPPRSESGYFGTTTKNTDLTQRETLEEIMLNLATLAGAQVIHKQQNSRGSFFYEVQGIGPSSFQSATNTILELSRLLGTRRVTSMEKAREV